MNKIQYDQTGGFPLNTNRLSNMQEAFSPLINGLGAMAGNLAIISGCIENGNTISDGVVQIGNEIFEFKAGIKQVYVTIFEENIAVEFENGQSKAVVIKRYITFGSGIQNYKWADFKRIPPLIELVAQVVQQQEEIKLLKKVAAPTLLGTGISLFNDIAANIPNGFEEVPESEWRGRIPVHINRSDPDFNTVGKTGGSKTHTQTIDEMPEHDHWIYGEDNNATVTNKPEQDELAQINDPDSGRAWRRRKTGKTGNGQAMNIMNPYRVVIFIRWKGETK